MSVELSVDYLATTDELRQWLNARSLPCWGSRNDMIVDRVKHELLLKDRVVFRKELTTTQNGLHPAMLQGKRITAWSSWSKFHQVRLVFESHDMVTFHCGEVPTVFIDDGLLKALLTLTSWHNGNSVTQGAEGRSLMVLKGELALQTSKAAGRKVGEYFPRAWCEQHVVIGLQLEGMDSVEYIYAHNEQEVNITSAYGNVTMGPLVPARLMFVLSDEHYPDPGPWGQVGGVGYAGEIGETATKQGLSVGQYPDPGPWGQVSGVGYAGETGVPSSLLGMLDEQYPDSGPWGKIGGTGHDGETGEETVRGYADEITEKDISGVANEAKATSIHGFAGETEEASSWGFDPQSGVNCEGWCEPR